MKSWIASAAVLLAGVADGQTALKTSIVEYPHGETVLEGYLALDDARPGKAPGVIVVHEWKGLGTHARASAERLAQLGYVALAIDMYGKGVRPADNKQAAAHAGKYKADRALMRARANAGLDWLRQQERVDPKRLAAIGYCFGGTTVLEMARSGAALAGVVSFHGALDSPRPADANNISAKILVLHGAEDPHVPPTQIAAFQEEMRQAKVDWQMVHYGGAVHSFTNPEAGDDPTSGVAYNERADRRSWEAMKTFLAEVCGQR